MSPPDVSVVIPARNVAATLGAQLEALSHSDTNAIFEVVVADNGSTDATTTIATSFADRLNVRVVDASRRPGANVARNDGVRAALANKILMCDGDDEVDEGWVAALCAQLDRVELTGGPIDYRRLNSDEEIAWRGSTASEPTEHQGFLPIAHGANLGFRRVVFDEIGGFDEHFEGGDDADFCWRAQLAGFAFAPASKAIVHYRLRSGLRPLLVQWLGYGAGEAHLYSRFRASGLRRRPVRAVAGSFWWLASRAPFALGDRNRRGAWVRVLATQIGRMKGSLQWRVFYV